MSQRWEPRQADDSGPPRGEPSFRRADDSLFSRQPGEPPGRANPFRAAWNSPQLLPSAVAGVVILVALVLVLGITMRPWAGPSERANTHLNIGNTDDEYERTLLAFLDEESGAPESWKPSAAGEAADSAGLGASVGSGGPGESDPSPVPGVGAFVGFGCASCHGIDGRGTPAGPPLAGSEIRRVETLTRKGPKGMPAYDEFHLSRSRLGAIAAYIEGLPGTPAPTPEPRATATPYPTITPTPTATPTPTPTPLPEGAPTPTPTPPAATPTPTATPDPVRLEESRQVFVLVGCDLCHGANGEGATDGPGLAGLAPDDIRDFVRKPVRPPDSMYSEEMDPYTEADLTNEELEAIVYFLIHLPD